MFCMALALTRAHVGFIVERLSHRALKPSETKEKLKVKEVRSLFHEYFTRVSRLKQSSFLTVLTTWLVRSLMGW